MRYTSAILAIFVIFLIGCAPTAPAPEASPGGVAPGPGGETADLAPIKIGVIGPFSGDAASLGADQRAGVDLAVQEINAEGGINGHQVEVIYEDGKCNGKDATTAATKLIDVDNVQFIVGGLCSSETLAAAPVAEAAGVVLISPASSSPDVTTAGDYVFRTWPSDIGQAKIMSEELIARGHQTVAVIYMNQDYNLALASAFKENYEALGGQIVAWETYDQEAKDFRTQVAKARAARPHAIYMVPYSIDGGLIVKQIRQLKMELPLFGSETMGSAETVEAAGQDNIEGLVYATPKFDTERPAAKDFLPKVQQIRGGDLSIPAIAADAFDATNLIAAALKASPAAEPTGALVKDYLYTVANYDGAGGVLTIDENGDAVKDFQLMNVHEGQFYPIPATE